jgi:hypothetical protein
LAYRVRALCAIPKLLWLLSLDPSENLRLISGGGRFRLLHKLSAKCRDLWDFRRLELRWEPTDYKLEIKRNSGCAAAVESVYRCMFPEDRRYINIPRQGRSGLNDTRMLL